MATYDELMAAARKAHTAGDKAAAKRLLTLAAEARKAPAAPAASVTPNPDGTYGTPPEGFVFNPNTGQMTSRELLANHAVQTGMGLGEAGAAGMAQGGTFGFSDELMAGANALIPGQGSMQERYDFGLEAGRAQLDAARVTHPYATLGAEVAGALAAPVGGAMSLGPKLWQRMLGGAIAGGAQGSVYGYGAGEGGAQNRADNAAWGGLLGGAVGGAIPLATEGTKRVLNALMSRRAIKEAVKAAPTTEALTEAGRKAYAEVDAAGVRVKPDVFAQTADDIVGGMKAGGLDVGDMSLTPKGMRIATLLSEAGQNADNSGVPFSEIDVLRRKAGIAAADMTPQGRPSPDSRLGTQAIAGLDDMVSGLDDTMVTAGDPAALQSAITKARETWGRMSRSQLIDDAIDASEDYLSGTASGIKNQFKRILGNPNLKRGFNAAEIAAMRKVVKGTPIELLGSALGRMAQTAAGAGAGSFFGPAGGAIGGLVGMATGEATKAIAGRSAQKKAELVRALIASGATRQPMPALSASKQALIEAIMRPATRIAPVMQQQ